MVFKIKHNIVCMYVCMYMCVVCVCFGIQKQVDKTYCSEKAWVVVDRVVARNSNTNEDCAVRAHTITQQQEQT